MEIEKTLDFFVDGQENSFDRVNKNIIAGNERKIVKIPWLCSWNVRKNHLSSSKHFWSMKKIKAIILGS